ncbi:CotS family spore coat protein [Clostridium amazonitimonense]|uniref:CotS family spore coat protein n=1 Tax=Clostridium amazonitimonense TaxID=1499689 RepID=UPI00050974E8|nr:CotS family spore coat protein [Clostridium amazonitimonense]
MEEDYIKAKLTEEYGIEVINIEKVKNVYKVEDEKGDFYALKLIKYEFPHFLFIISAMNHLESKGFSSIIPFMKTVKGENYIKIQDKHAYLSPWIIGREANYDNPIELSIVAKRLGELHIKSEGFTIDDRAKPRNYWFKWFYNFNSRLNEILDFRKRITNKEKLTAFDYEYVSILEEQLEKGKQALYYLGKSDYIEKMEKEIEKHGFCHHDLAHHNVIMKQGNDISIIDFDYCILDTHLHDLSSFLIRAMKNGKWDIDKARFILDSYNEIYTINSTDIPIMAAFMEFPQDYWQLGIQYYWEMQPWSEEMFLRKLNKIIEDRELKEDFIKEFRTQRYNGG